MVIYAEYLFLENALTGAIILSLTAKIGRLPTNRIRLFLGSIICGLFAFTIFIENTSVVFALVLKIGFCIFLSYVVFRKNIMKVGLLIYIVSACMGGITILLLYVSQIKGVSKNSVIYIGDITYTNVIFGVSVTALILAIFAKIMEEKRFKELTLADVILKFDGYQIKEIGLIDSGNFLKDPIFGRPVAVISKEMFICLKKYADVNWAVRFCLIPYSGIGIDHGLLEGYRIDEAYIDGISIGSIVVAIYEAEFCSLGRGEHYKILLNKDCLLGGVA